MLSKNETHIYYFAPLHFPKGPHVLDKLPNLPPWVPDFRVKDYRSKMSTPMESTDEATERYHLVRSLLDTHERTASAGPPFRHDDCARVHSKPRILPVTCADFTTLFITGSIGKLIIWTSGSSLSHLDTANETSDVQKLLQRIYSDVARTIAPRTFVSALIGALTGHGTLIKDNYMEAATELVSVTLKRSNSSQLQSKIDELANAVKVNAAHRTLWMTNDHHIGLSYHPVPDTGIRQGDIVVELFGFPVNSLDFILRPLDRTYHEMVNSTSMICCERRRDGRAGDVNISANADDNDTSNLLNDRAQVPKEDVYMPVPNVSYSSITPEYLQELKAQYRQYGSELYAIK
jgi:hypothetical protein